MGRILLSLTSGSYEPKINKICSQYRQGFIVPGASQIYMDYLMAHLYVANPQARIGAFESLSLAALQKLKEDGMVPSSNFKTSSTYSYQFVTAGEASVRSAFFPAPSFLISIDY